MTNSLYNLLKSGTAPSPLQTSFNSYYSRYPDDGYFTAYDDWIGTPDYRTAYRSVYGTAGPDTSLNTSLQKSDIWSTLPTTARPNPSTVSLQELQTMAQDAQAGGDIRWPNGATVMSGYPDPTGITGMYTTHGRPGAARQNNQMNQGGLLGGGGPIYPTGLLDIAPGDMPQQTYYQPMPQMATMQQPQQQAQQFDLAGLLASPEQLLQLQRAATLPQQYTQALAQGGTTPNLNNAIQNYLSTGLNPWAGWNSYE